MAEDRMQKQRFELKYIIREEQALQVRDFVSCYLECDEFGATMPNLSYPVHSLYLDSDLLSTYRATINGDKNRYKLRLRFYEDRPDAPVFFEVKSRTNNTISKKRGGVRRDAVDAILGGQLPSPAEMISKDPKNLAAIQHFCRLMNDIGAKPKAHIAYQREAWISRFDNSVRVTMDRKVYCDPEPTARLSTRMIKPVLVFGDSVIL
ncbi:MAG: VTC domain-containing protein, partial [Verrucomicrobiales bacterium]